MAKKQPRIQAPVVYTPHAEQACKDCGALGCLIPVPHTMKSTIDPPKQETT